MEEPGFTERDRKRLTEFAHIWEKMQEEDEALKRTAKLARLYMALVVAIFVPTVVFSGGNPSIPPFNWIFFGSTPFFLYGGWKLFHWYAAAQRRLVEEFRAKYGEEASCLQAKEDAYHRPRRDTDPFS